MKARSIATVADPWRDPWNAIYDANKKLLRPLQVQKSRLEVWNAMTPEDRASVEGLIVQGLMADSFGASSWAQVIRKLVLQEDPDA